MNFILTGLALLIAPAAFAQATPEQLAQIDTLLAAEQCEVDHANVEVEDGGGFDLDDVMCADGQYDIKLGPDMTIAERRKE
ncbi:hypothetical protein CNY89_06980 [Amaricoccus sp. HAR-UPW-R2A-40]|nr:hypothetical protein CNY89_06980 [Amaricoccus sp. HAR-UPW-R2A-40]